MDPLVAEVVLQIERNFEAMLAPLERAVHLPSRVRSLLWILSSLPVMGSHGHYIADESEIRAELHARLPVLKEEAAEFAVAMA
jgi:hypothetical protein